MKVAIAPKEKRAMQRVPTDNLEAYEFYLRGRRFLHEMTRKNLELARQMFSKAIELDPSYVHAHAGLADCGSVLYLYYAPDPEILNDALAVSRKALELDPGLAVPQFREAAEAAFPEAGWRILDSRRAAPRISRFIDRLTLFMTLVGLTSLLVGGVGVGNAVRSYLEEKTATIATLKCLGATGDLVFEVYLIQVMALALAAIAGGLVIGTAAPSVVSLLLGDDGFFASGVVEVRRNFTGCDLLPC